MRNLEYAGELGATYGYQGFALKQIPIRTGTEGKLVARNCVLFFGLDFALKDKVKAFCKKNGGGWDSIDKFWWVPTRTIAEAIDIIIRFREEVTDTLYMVCSGYDSPSIGKSIEKAILQLPKNF